MLPLIRLRQFYTTSSANKCYRGKRQCRLHIIHLRTLHQLTSTLHLLMKLSQPLSVFFVLQQWRTCGNSCACSREIKAIYVLVCECVWMKKSKALCWRDELELHDLMFKTLRKSCHTTTQSFFLIISTLSHDREIKLEIHYVRMSLLNTSILLMCTQPALSPHSPRPSTRTASLRLFIRLNADKWAGSYPFLILSSFVGFTSQYLFPSLVMYLIIKGFLNFTKGHVLYA